MAVGIERRVGFKSHLENRVIGHGNQLEIGLRIAQWPGWGKIQAPPHGTTCQLFIHSVPWFTHL